MLPGAEVSGYASAKLPDPHECPGKVITINKAVRPTYSDRYTVGIVVSDFVFTWYDNEMQANTYIDFHDYRKVVVWSDPTLLAASTKKGWRIIDSEMF